MVRELKANLSRYLRRVQAGATITVTDRGRAIATLQPVAPAASQAWVHQMVAEGRARWQGGKPIGLSPRIKRGSHCSQPALTTPPVRRR